MTPGTREENSAPVRSVIGRASRSARRPTVGPGSAPRRSAAVPGRQTERDRLEAESLQLPADEPGGPVLLPRKLRVFVELRAELMQVRLQRRLLGR